MKCGIVLEKCSFHCAGAESVTHVCLKSYLCVCSLPIPALSPRARENHSARLKGPSAQGRSVVLAFVELPGRPSFDAWDRSRHFPNLDEAFARSPSPRGRGRGEGEGFVRFSIASSILQVALIPPKIAKNLPVFERSFIECSPGRLRFGVGA